MLTLRQSLLYLIFSLAITLFCSSACQESTAKSQLNSNDFTIPTLLDRNEKIQLGKEWEYVQNFYSEQRSSFNENNNDLEALLNLAHIFIKEARITGEHGHYYPGALSVTDRILSAESEDQDLIFRALSIKAGIQLSLHEFETALNTGKKALALNPRNAQIHGVLVDAYVELGQYEEAIALADRMVSIKPDLRSYARVSYLREIHGDVDGAKKAMELAVKAGFPGYEETAWSMLTLGELYQTYGDHEKAKHIYQAILSDRPDYPFAVAALADVYYSDGDLATAETKLNEAINIIPEVGYYVQLSQIYKDQNRVAEFDKIIKEIFLMLEDDVAAGHNMNLEYAHLYLDILNQPEKALVFAKTEYNKRPQNIDVNRVLAKIYLEVDETKTATEHVIAASVTNSNHPDLKLIKAKL